MQALSPYPLKTYISAFVHIVFYYIIIAAVPIISCSPSDIGYSWCNDMSRIHKQSRSNCRIGYKYIQSSHYMPVLYHPPIMMNKESNQLKALIHDNQIDYSMNRSMGLAFMSPFKKNIHKLFNLDINNRSYHRPTILSFQEKRCIHSWRSETKSHNGLSVSTSSFEVYEDYADDNRNIDTKKQNQNEEFRNKIQNSLCNIILPQLLDATEYTKDCTDNALSTTPRIPPLIFIVAVSGGCDSIALFHGLHQILESNPSDMNTVKAINKSRESVTDSSQDNRSSSLFELNCSTCASANQKLSFSIKHNNSDKYNHHDTVPCELHVAHFDHTLRGEDSDNDRLFVELLCEEHNIPFHLYTWQQDSFSKQYQTFSQESARDWRRFHLIQLLHKLTSKCKYKSNDINQHNNHTQSTLPGIILTAHHADDSDETFLMKFLRGTHISNLSGLDAIQFHSQIHSNIKEYSPMHSKAAFVKPMLDIRKTEIQQFLLSQNFKWREDKSNASKKYVRNRIRNELLPLINDIIGNNEILHKRFQNMEEQSKLLKHHLNLQSDEYLKHHSTDSEFSLIDNGREIGNHIDHQYALHTWVEKCMNHEHKLTYDQFRYICDQIYSYPQQKTWTLNIGKGWNVIRYGDILRIQRFIEDKSHNHIDSDEANIEELSSLPSWIILDKKNYDHDKSQLVTLTLKIPMTCKMITKPNQENLVVLKAKGNENKLFTPTWRSGRTPIKLKDFLRGQKIPLHRRGLASILCMQGEWSNTVLAVFIEKEVGVRNSGKWMMNAQFDKDRQVGETVNIPLLYKNGNETIKFGR